MSRTFLGNRYEIETPVITTSTISFTTAKYRGIEYQAVSRTVPVAATCTRKYRGIAY
jgi:hypothetical protein